jgi:Pyruvate/2-oxoacid:ferredoxin oxidoreductase gamma subunit
MKAMVGVVLAILIIFGFRLFWPSADSGFNETSQTEVTYQNIDEQVESSDTVASESTSSETELDAENDKERTRLMRAAYEVLEEARTKLKRHIAKLKHEMWGLKFTKEKAKKISTTVMGANKLLKNPHMLGAFSNVEQIQNEIAKVNFAEKSLEEIDEIIKAKIEENANSADHTNSAMQ